MRLSMSPASIMQPLLTICIPDLMQSFDNAVPEQEQDTAYLTLTCTAKHPKYKIHKSDAS